MNAAGSGSDNVPSEWLILPPCTTFSPFLVDYFDLFPIRTQIRPETKASFFWFPCLWGNQPWVVWMIYSHGLQISYQRSDTPQLTGEECSGLIKSSPSSLWLSWYVRNSCGTDFKPNDCSLHQIGSGSFPLPRTWTLDLSPSLSHSQKAPVSCRTFLFLLPWSRENLQTSLEIHHLVTAARSQGCLQSSLLHRYSSSMADAPQHKPFKGSEGGRQTTVLQPWLD